MLKKNVVVKDLLFLRKGKRSMYVKVLPVSVSNLSVTAIVSVVSI